MAKDVDRYRTERTTGKTVDHKRISKERMAELMADADLSAEDFAIIWGTRPQRVQEWLNGEQDIPFPIAWALALLAHPDNFEEVQRIIEPLMQAKPQYRQRDGTRKKLKAVLSAIEERLPEARRLLENHRASNPGAHPYEDAFSRLDAVKNARGVMNISRQLAELEQIAGIIGLGIDVNAEIEKANAPFIERIAQDRRSRLAEQRKAAPPLPAYRQGKREP